MELTKDEEVALKSKKAKPPAWHRKCILTSVMPGVGLLENDYTHYTLIHTY